jgi:hypothetical protein
LQRCSCQRLGTLPSNVEDFEGKYITGLELEYERVIVGAPLWARVASEAPPPGQK